MDKTVLDKYKNNPAWVETIKLYSGLFETDNERKDFILELAETDILLATECSKTELTANNETETGLKEKLKKTSKNTLQQVVSAINLNSISEISNSRKSLLIANKIAHNLDERTILKICNHWVKSKVKGKVLIHKKDLQHIKNLLEKTNMRTIADEDKEFLDMLISNVYSHLNRPDKLGVDVVKRVFDIISVFNYRAVEYKIKVYSFLKSKKEKLGYRYLDDNEFQHSFREIITALIHKPINRDSLVRFLNSETLNKRKHFYQALSYIIDKFSFETHLELFYELRPGDKSLFINSVFRAIYDKLLKLEEYNKINELLSAIVYIGYDPKNYIQSLESRNIKLSKNSEVLTFIKSTYLNPSKKNFESSEFYFSKLQSVFGYTQSELVNFINS